MLPLPNLLYRWQMMHHLQPLQPQLLWSAVEHGGLQKFDSSRRRRVRNKRSAQPPHSTDLPVSVNFCGDSLVSRLASDAYNKKFFGNFSPFKITSFGCHTNAIFSISLNKKKEENNRFCTAMLFHNGLYRAFSIWPLIWWY